MVVFSRQPSVNLSKFAGDLSPSLSTPGEGDFLLIDLSKWISISLEAKIRSVTPLRSNPRYKWLYFPKMEQIPSPGEGRARERSIVLSSMPLRYHPKQNLNCLSLHCSRISLPDNLQFPGTQFLLCRTLPARSDDRHPPR